MPYESGEKSVTVDIPTPQDEVRKVRVLVANEPRSYRQVYAYACRRLRPRAEVREVEPECLDREVRLFHPDLVVCSRVTDAVRDTALVWVELLPEGEPVAMVCAAGELTTIADVQIDNLLFVIDWTENLIHAKKS